MQTTKESFIPCIKTGTIETKPDDNNMFMSNSSTLAHLEKVDSSNCNKCQKANMTSRSFMKGSVVKTEEKTQDPTTMDFVKRYEPNRTFVIKSYR